MTKKLSKEQEQNRKNMKEAILLWAGMMAVYAVLGLVRIFLGVSLAALVNLLFVLICIITVRRKKQGLSSLGLAREHAGHSCKTGLICAAAIILLNGILPGIVHNGTLAAPGSLLMWLLYYMVLIAIPEEIIFRGYLLTRLEAGLQSGKKAIFLSGLLFVLIHIPYQFLTSGMHPAVYLLNGNLFTLFMTFIWHLVFCWIFKKTQSLYGAILFHGLMDWSNALFTV